MSNRLNKTDFLAVYLFLLIIAFFIGGFFLGAKVAQQKASVEFARYVTENDGKDEDTERLKYSHTDFASYYYNIYLPTNEFREHYLLFSQQLKQSAPENDQKAMTTDLRKVIKKTKIELNKTSMPNSSPLLQKAQETFLSSLNAYEIGIGEIVDNGNMNTKQITKTLNTHSQFKQAEEHWLQAQSLFYEAVVLWDSFYVTKETPALLEKPELYTLNQWNNLRFHQKSELIAKLMFQKRIISSFNPEDTVVYLDSLAASGSSSQVDKVSDAVDFLLATGAIRQGEFINRIEQYSEVLFPMIPLFSK
jgi:hypothetical protein